MWRQTARRGLDLKRFPAGPLAGAGKGASRVASPGPIRQAGHSDVRTINALGAVGAILAAAVVFAILACCLPDDPYQRFPLLDGTDLSEPEMEL